MKKILLLSGLVAIAVLMSSHRVNAADLNLGGSYVTIPGADESGLYNPLTNTTGGAATDVSEGGGSVGPSTLNGTPVFVYCIQIPVNVFVPGDYNATIVTDNATVDLAPDPQYPSLVTQHVANAGAIAWLLDNIVPGADTNLQGGLQAAIWHEVYGAGYVLNNSYGDSNPLMYAAYVADLALLGSNTAPLATIAWMTPAKSTDPATIYYQALITQAVPGSVSTPESSSLVVWSLLGAIGIAVGWRRRDFLLA
jgi:hypothetical protein